MIKSQVNNAKKQARTSRRFYSSTAYRQTYNCVSIIDNETHYQTTLQAPKVNQSFEDISYCVITCKCKEIAGEGIKACKDNSQSVCTHTMAALIKNNENKGNVVTFFDSFKEAFISSSSGGSLYKLQSTQGWEGYTWMVVKSKMENKLVDSPATYHINPSHAFNKRVSMLRGPFEEGIN